MSSSDATTHRFNNDRLAVTVAADGAELSSLHSAAAGELLWQAGPEWPRHAPVLFPIVGRLAGDTLRQDGRDFRMTQHGFARDRRFDWLERDATGCRLVLRDDAGTRAIYPFRFTLEIGYRLQGDRLAVEYRLHTRATRRCRPRSARIRRSAGRSRDEVPKTAHRLVFACDEPAPIRRVAGGLLRAEPEPSPVDGRVLLLDERLFADDAVILDQPASALLRYEAPGAGPVLVVAWHGMTALGIWSKPGAGFLCIEPWHGLASPAGFDGPFADKPHLMHLPPGAEARLGWSVQVEAPDRT